MSELIGGLPERYQYIEIGRAAEQLRIINLFEATEKHFYEFTVVEGYTQKTHSPVCHLCERIDRIKGLRK